MKIKTNITTERELDIKIPFFRKDNTFISFKYFAVLDEKTVIDIFDSDDRTSVSVDNPERVKADIAKNYETLAPITEQEFLLAHEKALKRLSLVPQLTNDLPDNLFNGQRDADYPLLNMPD